MKPFVAPGITIATKTVPVFEIIIAFWPPIASAVGLLKFVPFMVTNVPTAPLEGLNDVIAGPDIIILLAVFDLLLISGVFA
jgi:hypothetical protein